jgi:MFS transporter, OFA family, oxalate/formate antiporter
MTSPPEADPYGTQPAARVPRRGYVVLLAGLLSNFSVGILYTWSNIRDTLEGYEEWAVSQLTIPFSIGGLTFAVLLIVAGTLQDRYGPRPVMLAGTVMVGGGTILSALVTRTPGLFSLSFGVVVGAGLAFVYACPRPAAMKWFHPSRKGMINGLVVTGFGLGALWLGPTQLLLLHTFGYSLERTLVILGVLILAIGLPCAAAMVDPPAGYAPPSPERDSTKPVRETHRHAPSVALRTAIRTPQAWMLLAIYALFCSAGAMVIGSVGSIMSTQTQGGPDGALGPSLAVLLPLAVPILAITNAMGRTTGGIGSDYLGRRGTYVVMHVVLLVNMFLLQFWTTPSLILMGALVAGACYGAALAVTPSIVADYFGLKAYGANYGFVFFGWGISLLLGPQIGSSVLAATGSYVGSYYAAIGLLSVSLLLVLLLRQPRFSVEQVLDGRAPAAVAAPMVIRPSEPAPVPVG